VTEKGVPLLKRVSFSLPEGKMTALLGLSGDGKSTLMDGMAGLCNPSHKTYGEVYVKGKSGTLEKRKAEEWFSRVNYTQQSMIEYKKIPAYDVLCSIAKCYGKKEQEVDDYMSMLRISKVKKVHFNNLSGGEQRRAMVIAGLLAQKDLNIWDEPLTGLDSEMARVILSMMKKSQSTNLVTVHQVSEDLMKRFDHVILMHKSTIIYSGPAGEIQKYFTDKGIEFPADAFYVNYLMQLCAENSDNHTDIKNIEIFNTLANEIVHSQCGEKAGENIKFLPLQLKLSFTGIIEILKRSLYMDRLFKGSSIIGNLLFPLFLTTVGSLAFILILNQACGGLKENRNPIDKYYYPDQALYYPNVLYVFKKKISESPDVDALFLKQVSAIHTMVANIGWISILSKLFNFALFYGGSIGCLMVPGSFLVIEFYKLCKTSIAAKQFKVGDFMGAQVVDIIVRKSFVLWIILMALYFVVCRIVDPNLLSATTIGHLLPLTILVFSVLLMGLHAVMLHYAPITLKLFGLFAGLYILITQGIPGKFYTIASKSENLYGHAFSIDESISIFTKESVADLIQMVKRTEMSDGKKKLANLGINIAVKLTRFFIVCDPSLYFSQILAKISLYSNKITIDPELAKTINAEVITRIAEGIEAMDGGENESDRDHRPSKDNSMGTHLTKYLITACLDRAPNEVFNNSVSLKKISLFHIGWSVLRFWLLPIALLALTGLYTYRFMLPKLRN
ncbi:ATP-binding cassette, subfamily G (WHITE), member 5 (sterolin 1), partial [Nematocida ausubeli]